MTYSPKRPTWVMAPIFGLSETQRGRRVQRPHYEVEALEQQRDRGDQNHYRDPKVHRRRSSRDAQAARKKRNNRISCVLAATVIVLAFYGGLSLAHRRPSAAGDFGHLEVYQYDEVSSFSETEGARLEREIYNLETILLKKKSLLGVAPGAPLDGRTGVDASGGGDSAAGIGWNRGANPVVAQAVRGDNIRERHREQSLGLERDHDRPHPHLPHLAGEAAPRPPKRRGVPGEALFGMNPVRQSLESRSNMIREPVPLIVGGTDGSGTRGVVALLQQLKVPVVIEDGGTKDIHGSPYLAKGGWPVVVRPVIQWARGARYNSQDAPANLRRPTLEALGRLHDKMDQSAAALPQPDDGRSARYVSWAFKAPVSMLLVPFFAEAWGKAKFLHVVRDGRDIAFSGNQTPVTKFYAETFPQDSRESNLKEPSLKAIAMWNAWNVGLHDWAAGKDEHGGAGLDYLLLHAEDLLNPSAKLAAIKDVAEFVGSPLSDKELCCIATEGSKDMGSHTTARKERGHVTARFGKWKSKVEGSPLLSRMLHGEGERGLRVFGYEPQRSSRLSDGYSCPEEHDETCPKLSAAPPGRANTSRAKKKRLNTTVPTFISDTATCVGLNRNTDFKGFDLTVAHSEVHLDCCEECRISRDCTHFTFDYRSGNCYLKSGKGSPSKKDGLVSGTVLVP